jgi:hypothetical protein
MAGIADHVATMRELLEVLTKYSGDQSFKFTVSQLPREEATTFL